MTIRIVCSGKITDTKIIDVESGVELQDDCTKAMIILDAKKNVAEVTLKFTDVALDVTGEVVETFPPMGIRLKDIVMR